MKKDFEYFYKNLKKNKLEEIWNDIQQNKRKKFFIILGICIVLDFLILAIVPTVLDTYDLDNESILTIVLLMILSCDVFVAITFVAFRNINKNVEYRKSYKEDIVKEMITSFFDSVAYMPEKGMIESEYIKVNPSEPYNDYSSDDYTEGLIDEKYPIKFADIRTSWKGSDDNFMSDGRPVFEGIFAKIDLDFYINIVLTLKCSLYPIKRLHTDDDEFNFYYQIECCDKSKSLQYLTHDVMEKLINLRKRVPREYEIMIAKDSIYIKLNASNAFEAVIINQGSINKRVAKYHFMTLQYLYDISKEIIKITEEQSRYL